jgi:hypothetical protein
MNASTQGSHETTRFLLSVYSMHLLEEISRESAAIAQLLLESFVQWLFKTFAGKLPGVSNAQDISELQWRMKSRIKHR